MNMLEPNNLGIQIEDSDTAIPSPISGLETTFENEQHLELLYKLHSSLDIKTIIHYFAEGVAREVATTGISYRYIQPDISVTIGTHEEHRFVYNLCIGEDPLGEITFTRNQRFTETEITKLEDLICLLVFPLKNALQHYAALQTALRDPLTGLANRAALESALSRDIELAKRHDMPFSILALDLDRFKAINDTFGHLAGDAVLKALAEAVNHTIRDSDIAFRIGGEEFIVLLSKTDFEGAIKLADRICKAVAQLKTQHQENTINTTISIGVAAYVSGDNNLSLLEKADQALYRAKQEGRNRVCI